MTNVGCMWLMPEFISGVDGFVDYAMTLEPFQLNGLVKCPFSKCKCWNYEKPDIVKLHLYRNRFKKDYTLWASHGEVDNSFFISQYYVAGGNCGVVELDLEASSRPLYKGSPHSQLSITVRLLSIKLDLNIPQGAMDAVIDLMHELVDLNLEIPCNFYKAKMLVSKLGLLSIRIDCCKNGCMLYYMDDIELESCKYCQRAHFKKAPSGKKVVVKVMHYLPLILRLKRLYVSNRLAPHMRRHHKNRRPPRVMCYLSDREAWKHFDRKYPEFIAEPRNIRLGLCSDGFTPYSVSVAPYSCWPVYLTPYNLPPEMCMTSRYIFLNYIIPGLRNLKILIDVYLRPLIEELNQLWIEGVEIFDVSLKKNFNLQAVLMWTISDFPTYEMLSGWMTAGKLECPYCMENTKSFTLKHGQKTCWFDCHCQFLPMDHEFRNMKNAFRKNKIDRDYPPPIYMGEHVWERVRHYPKVTEEQPYKFDGTIGNNKWSIKQQHRIEGSMYEAYIAREMANFCSYYFASDVQCSRSRPNHHDDGGVVAREPLSIFNQPGEGSKNRTRRHLSSMEFKSASIHVLLNCPQVKPFLE
ncbi:uncharacterized protein LOC124889667 [Capsicum annuum]|uniref:uncharacterized protein LOC124889667 n=1 Tax=Capsicum annuum TaxID=4072 RepID=UPI001FB131F5|nr:uncharacterized protein LOC124889667 [Capsicum annuum]